jgi:hypothetical protein
MKPKVYIETTIPSYLTAWPSRDLIRAAHQQSTREWWNSRRSDFDLFVSDVVVLEASAGDPIAASERLEILKGLPILKAVPEALKLSEELLLRVPLPPRAALDSLHISIAVVTGMDFLLTWNCNHIANATLRPRIEAICHAMGYSSTTICTPTELMKE